MRILPNIFRRTRVQQLGGLENPNNALTPALIRGSLDPLVNEMRIGPDSAMQIAAVLACVRVLSESIASLTLPVYRRLPKAGKERAPQHPTYQLLHNRPNPYLSSFQWRELAMKDLLLEGNHYAEIEWHPALGYIRALWPLPSRRTELVRRTGEEPFYRTYLNDGPHELSFERVLHIPGLGDGYTGESVVRYGAKALGLAAAQEKYNANFFIQGSTLSGVLESDKELSEPAFNRLSEGWKMAHQGVGQAHKIAILEDGVKWKNTGVSPEDAQILGLRKFSVTEIARMFRVPPHMIADLERSTFSNIEHQDIDFVKHTIRPWCVRFEQQLNWKLFDPGERGEYFAEFLLDSELRGDTKSRNEAYHIMRQDGIINADEWRELENMNPQPDNQGKTYLVPLNMQPAQWLSKPAPVAQAQRISDLRSRQPQNRRKAARALTPVFISALERTVRRERHDIMAAARKMLPKRDIPELEQWLEKFWQEHHEYVTQQLRPVHQALAETVRRAAEAEIGADSGWDTETFVAAYTATFSERYTGRNAARLREVIAAAQKSGADVLAALDEQLAEWEENRPAQYAGEETVRGEGAFARATFASAGVTSLIWVANADACPYCAALDGKVVSIEAPFVGEGGSVNIEGQPSLSPGSSIGHPPLHAGCQCSIVAG